MKRNKGDIWGENDTKLFYKSLAQYGTDFTMIAQMFPKRNRGQIKNKFKREEKDHPHLVEQALQRRMPIGMHKLLTNHTPKQTLISCGS